MCGLSTFVPVNDVCNLGCTFCGIGRRGPRPDAELQGRLDGVTGGRVTFGGGEPTVDERLPGLVASARDRGAESIVVETNGVNAADPSYVAALVAAGLTGARWMVPARQVETWAQITGDAQHFDEAWLGAANLLAAGLRLDVVIPVSQTNVAGLSELVAEVAARLPEVSSVTLRPVFFSMPRAAREPSGGGGEGARRNMLAHAADIRERAASEMVPMADLAEALAGALLAAGDAEIRGVIDAPEGLPLCALRHHVSAIAAVRTRRTGAEGKPPACFDCAMLERCGGQGAMDAAVFGPWAVRPFDRIPPALVRNKHPEPVYVRSPGLPGRGTGPGDKAEIRVVMPCNQDCTFCFVNREAPSPSREMLEGAVDEVATGGVEAIVFTGGEPTLSQHLVPLVARAAAAGVSLRGIQTNALRLAEGPLVDELVEAGLNHAHVSLHAVDPERYRSITGFGEPADAARGARRLVEAGVEVSISLVICQANVDHMTPTLTFIREEVGPVEIVLSVAREQLGLHRPWDRTLLSYTDAANALIEALEVGQELGLYMGSAGTCSMPPCVLPADKLARHADAVLVANRTMTWEGEGEAADNAVSNEFVAACNACAVRSRCPGIQRTYLERRGDAEFIAVLDAP